MWYNVRMDHLQKRRNRYYVRIAVPKDLRAVIGKIEIIKSTGTAEKVLARRIASREYCRQMDRFDDLRNQRAPSDSQMTIVAHRVMTEEVHRWSGILGGPGDRETLALVAHDVIDQWRGYLDDYPLFAEARDEVKQLIADNSLALQKDTEPYRRFCTKIARAHIAAAQEALRKARGDYSAHPLDDLADATPDATLAHLGHQRHQHPHGAAMSSATFDKWLSEGAQQDRWSPRTQASHQTGRDAFLEILGDMPVAAITRDHVRTLRDALAKLPADWRRHCRARGISAVELLNGDPVGPGLKPGSRTKLLQATKSMLAFAVDEGLVDTNVAMGLTNIPDREPVKDKRHAWSVELLNQWLSYRIYKEPRGTWGYRQWLPLVALFSGARLEELAQLLHNEVREVDNVLVFNFQRREGASLKTQAAERIVPVHIELLHLGFGQYLRRTNNSKYLWPDLRVPKPGGRWGSAFTTYFTRARRDARCYDQKCDYHSLRATFVTAMVNQRISPELIPVIVGHAVPSLTFGTYTKGIDVKVLQGAVDQVSYPGLHLPPSTKEIPACSIGC